MYHKVRFVFFLFLSIGLSPFAHAGMLSGTFTSIATGSNVDLTATGKLDWVHWGLYTDTSINRKGSVSPQISNFTVIGNTSNYLAAYQYSGNSNSYSWSDGTPVASVTNTTTGVWAYGTPFPVGTGFQLTAPAGTNEQILELFVGVYAGRGKLTATLSDGSATEYSNTSLENLSNGPGGVYKLTYAANSPGQTLTVQWVLDLVAGSGATTANVTLQAAALTATNADNPPFVTLTNPANFAAFSSPASVVIGGTAQDPDGTVTNISLYAGTTKLGQATASPFSFTWANPPLGHYILEARATDNAGVTSSSQPIEIFVYGSGGGQTNAILSPPATVDLTAEGTADWEHWGIVTSGSVDHKNLGPSQISNVTVLGTNTVEQYTNNFTAFSWSDGTPTVSTAGTATGIFITGLTNGFALTAPADQFSRELRVYVGGYGVQGVFEAYLSDFSAPPLVDMSVSNVYNNSYALYVIDYTAASTNQQLIVNYRSLDLFDYAYGNVTLQAASLQSSGPVPVLLTNPEWQGNAFAFSFLTQANHSYTVRYTYSLAPANWQILTNFAGDGSVMSVTNENLASSNCFYQVLTQ